MTFDSILPIRPMLPLGDAARALRANLAVRRKARNAYNQTFNELSATPARDLADIGIDPADIRAIAAQAAVMAA
ncbi:MAG: DUF1127 domain-containing protein [Pseudomonadota bacterium]